MSEKKDSLLSLIEKSSNVKLKITLLVNKAMVNVKKTYTEHHLDGGFYDDLNATVRCFNSLAKQTLSNIDLFLTHSLGNLDINLVNSLIEKYNGLHDSRRLYCVDVSTTAKQINEKRFYIISIISIIEELNTHVISITESLKSKPSVGDKIVEIEGCDVSFNITKAEIIIDDKPYKINKVTSVIKSSRKSAICKILYGIISTKKTLIHQYDKDLIVAGGEYARILGLRKGDITNLSSYISDVNNFLKTYGSRWSLKKHSSKVWKWTIEEV